MLVVTQESGYFTPANAHGQPQAFSPRSWQLGMEALLNAVKVPGIRKVVLGNIPFMTQSVPVCPRCIRRLSKCAPHSPGLR